MYIVNCHFGKIIQTHKNLYFVRKNVKLPEVVDLAFDLQYAEVMRAQWA